jgi:hypothetical protein
MTSIISFESNVYSEELYPMSESDHDEVMRMVADDGFDGYCEWSRELEQGQRLATPRGEILINKECSHATCKTTRCDKAQSYRGIAI